MENQPSQSAGVQADAPADRRRIEWNKVTWYSKAAAVIVGITVYLIGFYTGAQWQSVKDTAAVILSATHTNISMNVTSDLISKVAFVCDGGKTITADFYSGNYSGNSQPVSVSPSSPPTPTGSVSLALSDGRVIDLSQTISADGARYANAAETIVFWAKGDGAFIEEGAVDSKTGAPMMTYANCHD